MVYGILLFLGILVVLVLSRVLVAKMGQRSTKYVNQRWFWGIVAVALLTLGVLLPAAAVILRGLLIGLAVFGAMVFFELNRKFYENV